MWLFAEAEEALVNMDQVKAVYIRAEYPGKAPPRYEVVAELVGGGTVVLWRARSHELCLDWIKRFAVKLGEDSNGRRQDLD